MSKIRQNTKTFQMSPAGGKQSKNCKSRERLNSKRATKMFHQEGKGNLDLEDSKDKEDKAATSGEKVIKKAKGHGSKDKDRKEKDTREEKKKEEEGKTDEPGTTTKKMQPTKTSRDAIQKWCEKIMARRAFDINKEFILNKTYKPPAFTTEAFNRNEQKNRYADIFCMDAHRVVLKDRPADDNYIHANWMMMPDKQAYICTQGPLTATIDDFWHMIFTERSNCIVMLTALEDDGVVSKCSPYFPVDETSDPLVTGSYKISQKDKEKEPFSGIKWRELTIERDGQLLLLVNHFTYDTWTDHTAPTTAAAAVGLSRLCRKLADGTPITVHCSAGIGRSATFIGIDYAHQRVKAEGDACKMVDVFRELRGMRLHAVQSAVQYLFLHLCLLEMFAQDGLIAHISKYDKWLASYQTLLQRVLEKNKKISKERL